MITFKAIIIPGNRRKDGTYPVNIRVTFKGKSRRLSTTLVCTSGDLTRSLKIKNPTILNKSDELITRMRDAVKDLSPFDLDTWDVDRVVSHIRTSLSKETFHLDFFAWSEEYVIPMNASTKRAYITALNSLERFLGKRSIDINDISRSTLMGMMEMVDNEPRMRWDRKTGTIVPTSVGKIPKGASTRQVMKLEHLFNAAKNKFNDEDSGRILIPRSPFSNLPKVFPICEGQRNLGEEVMQSIISYETDCPFMRESLDLFILSFGLMGANLADLYYARPFSGDVWIYNRRKTMNKRSDKAEMRVRIPEEMKPYIDRLKGTGEWWLNNLHRSDLVYVNMRINRHLKRWAEANGVDKFTSYAARHTWASLARRHGVDKSTVDDCLAHKGDYSVTDIYAEKAWNLMEDANRIVLDLFTW